jgi:Na+/pantothenate symporter
MTFAGWNYDIVAGATAPIATVLSFTKRKVVRASLLLGWNILALLLLGNIVVTAVLSAEVPFQLLAFDQPNRAVTYFPFNLLPSVIVPIVLFAHLASIRKLWIQRKEERINAITHQT